jgi:glycine cleavage system aminomethyltransferase T
MIALASVATEYSKPGTKLKMEFTVEAVRHRVSVTIANLPFFNPPRKMATPAA